VQVNEVKVLETKTLQHLVQLLGRDVFAVLIGPELAGHPDTVTRDTAVLDGAADAALIAVCVGRVDVAVTGLQGRQHRIVSDFSFGDRIDAEAELGHHDAIVKGKGGLVHG